MKLLVLNSGSSSVKYKVFEAVDGQCTVMTKGIVERIGLPGARVRCACCLTNWENCDKQAVFRAGDALKIDDHSAAIESICHILMSPKCGVLKDISEINAIGHRVVHGGERFSESVIIDDDVLDGIRQCARLAPLHNPPALLGIEASKKYFPDVPQIAVFDTAFHHTIPKVAFLYGLPMEYYSKHGIRKYGFHGTSHRYVSGKAIELLEKPVEDTRIITCHLGNGSSITAVKGGKSVDTSMGLTPLAGVMMGTRSGNMDPYIPLFMIKEVGLSVDEVDHILNKQSGLEGICNSTDMRDVEAHAARGDADAQLALDMFAYRIRIFVGAYALIMGGVDAIVFTAGVGERDASMRARIVDNLDFLGLKLDPRRNENHELDISADGSSVKVFVIPTDEERVIAQDTERLAAAALKSDTVAVHS